MVESEKAVETDERKKRLGVLSLLFYLDPKSKERDIFVQDRLEYIRSIEKKITDSPEYQDLCLLFTKKEISNVDGSKDLPKEEWKEECMPPFSPTLLFYPTLNESEPRKYNLLNVYDFVRF